MAQSEPSLVTANETHAHELHLARLVREGEFMTHEDGVSSLNMFQQLFDSGELDDLETRKTIMDALLNIHTVTKNEDALTLYHEILAKYPDSE
jgi:hypothetical protein